MCQKVYRLRRCTMTVTFLPYGNGYRVKYVKVSNSYEDSKLLAHLDEEYTDKHEAVQAFKEICHICAETRRAHFHKRTYRFEPFRQAKSLEM